MALLGILVCGEPTMQLIFCTRLSDSWTRPVAIAAIAVGACVAHGDLLGPTPYLQISDSPFAALALPDFQVETFEDSALAPGLVASGGNVVGPGVFTDSVDADDGNVDGSGFAGHSWYSGNTNSTMRFTFDAGALGGLPRFAGIVWTDVGAVSGPVAGVSDVIFEAFDALGASLGTIGPVTVGDGSARGETVDDRFFGATNAGGISAIELRMPESVDWEVDHVQWAGVPEPATGMLLLLAAGLIRRR